MTDFKIRKQKVVADMATSFTSEGYIIMIKSESLALMFYRLKHQSNGNVITITAQPLHNHFEIKKNGTIIKQGDIIKQQPNTVHQP